MKKLLALLVLIPSAAQAQPFKYKTPCYLETPQEYIEDICTVVETRNNQGFLNTRNIYSNKFSLTVKLRWDKQKEKFMTWDSHNKFEYNWEYKPTNIPNKQTPHTYVMPGLLLESVSYD